jgi:hypothetical protein
MRNTLTPKVPGFGYVMRCEKLPQVSEQEFRQRDEPDVPSRHCQGCRCARVMEPFRRPYYHEVERVINLGGNEWRPRDPVRPSTAGGYEHLLTTSNSISFPPKAAALALRRPETSSSFQSLASSGAQRPSTHSLRGRPFGSVGLSNRVASLQPLMYANNLNGVSKRHSAHVEFELARSREMLNQWRVEARFPGPLAHHDSPLRALRFCG